MQHNLLLYLYLIGIPFLDRLGGGGFGFLSPRIPDLLARGFKPARRFGIPIALFLLSPTPLNAVYMAVLSLLFSLNLKEIEEKWSDEIVLYSLVLFFALGQVCGLYAALPAAWWPLGIYLSNTGIKGRKLAWHWVELIRGALIPAGALLYGAS